MYVPACNAADAGWFGLGHHADPSHLCPADGTATRIGTWVPEVHAFDAAAFGLGTSESSLMDPQQRLLLEDALAAICDSGRCVPQGRPRGGAGRACMHLFAAAFDVSWLSQTCLANESRCPCGMHHLRRTYGGVA